MFFVMGSPKSIEDLRGKSTSQVVIRDLRPKVSILVIDDSPFAQKDNLKNQNYKIDQVHDLQSWEAAAGYNVVLCDINGVGKALGGEDGGFLIKELKKHYPQKYVMAYSGQTFNPTHNRYFNQADQILKKDSDLEEWIDKLDETIKAMVDPILQWKRARWAMVQEGLRLELILHLEDEFVTNIEKQADLKKWQETRLIKKLEPTVKKIIYDLVVSVTVGKIV